MWECQSEDLPEVDGRRFVVIRDRQPATVAQVIHAWQNDAEFRKYFNSLLAELPYAAFRWETPAVTERTTDRAFECVALNCPGLARTPDVDAFAEHVGREVLGMATFANRGGDALLVVPGPVAPANVYGHLAAFVRLAPESQQQALWQAVGAAMARRIGAKPVWLSTAGAGVAWLHVRLDDRPKYYRFAPYR